MFYSNNFFSSVIFMLPGFEQILKKPVSANPPDADEHTDASMSQGMAA